MKDRGCRGGPQIRPVHLQVAQVYGGLKGVYTAVFCTEIFKISAWEPHPIWHQEQRCEHTLTHGRRVAQSSEVRLMHITTYD